MAEPGYLDQGGGRQADCQCEGGRQHDLGDTETGGGQVGWESGNVHLCGIPHKRGEGEGEYDV